MGADVQEAALREAAVAALRKMSVMPTEANVSALTGRARQAGGEREAIEALAARLAEEGALSRAWALADAGSYLWLREGAADMSFEMVQIMEDPTPGGGYLVYSSLVELARMDEGALEAMACAAFGARCGSGLATLADACGAAGARLGQRRFPHAALARLAFEGEMAASLSECARASSRDEAMAVADAMASEMERWRA